jgi:RNA polymerase sigma-70 factor (ECF subfamily)
VERDVEIEALYHRHGPALLAYLRRSFGPHAEDLLQESFLHALRSRDQCLQADSPRAFLFGIARNVGLSALRKSRSTTPLVDVPAPLEKEDPTLAAMRVAIRTLPDQIRETLELRLREELSYEEIAAVLQIPLGTVRSRLHTALKLLREQLKEEQP